MFRIERANSSLDAGIRVARSSARRALIRSLTRPALATHTTVWTDDAHDAEPIPAGRDLGATAPCGLPYMPSGSIGAQYNVGMYGGKYEVCAAKPCWGQTWPRLRLLPSQSNQCP